MLLSDSTGSSKIIVYLDSSDYSSLSAPRDGSLEKIRDELLDFSSSGKVVFAYSGVHLSEMSPLDTQYSDSGVARIDFLVELCGKNAFFSLDRLIESEVLNLATLGMSKIDVLSQDGTWFPAIENIASPVKWLDLVKPLDGKLKEQGLNRKQRRAMKKKLTKSGKTPSQFLNSLDTVAELDYEKFLSLYPMRPQDMEVIRNYVREKASASDVEEAFVNSLRDPRWMARWFSEHYDEMASVGNWFRAPARKFTETMGNLANKTNIELAEFGNKKTRRYLVDKVKASQDELLLRLVNEALEDLLPHSPPAINIEHIKTYCPGISCLIGSSYSYILDSVGVSSRNLKDSDFIDVIHSMYAPYVSLFRADRYMAPHIRNNLVGQKPLIAHRLEDTPDKISELLEKFS